MKVDSTSKTFDVIEAANAPTPTDGTYQGFQQAYTHFNRVLFDGELPECLITLQRKRGTGGYFAAERFGHRRDDEIIDEIALNPASFLRRTDAFIASVIAHEMAHLWQFHFGKPSRRGYHNKQWAQKMRSIGLTPSHSGQPGGKQTGQRMSHYIEVGGAYDQAWTALEKTGFALNYQDRVGDVPKDRRQYKVCYICPVCSIHAWGKPDIRIACLDCDARMR
jgi:predicted SprT family Zn-dependent metalloprotease